MRAHFECVDENAPIQKRDMRATVIDEIVSACIRKKMKKGRLSQAHVRSKRTASRLAVDTEEAAMYWPLRVVLPLLLLLPIPCFCLTTPAPLLRSFSSSIGAHNPLPPLLSLSDAVRAATAPKSSTVATRGARRTNAACLRLPLTDELLLLRAHAGGPLNAHCDRCSTHKCKHTRHNHDHGYTRYLRPLTTTSREAELSVPPPPPSVSLPPSRDAPRKFKSRSHS